MVTITQQKPWWRSKTMRVNLIVTALLLAEANLQLVQPIVPVNLYAVAAFGLPIINMLLRAITTSGISLRSLKP